MTKDNINNKKEQSSKLYNAYNIVLTIVIIACCIIGIVFCINIISDTDSIDANNEVIYGMVNGYDDEYDLIEDGLKKLNNLKDKLGIKNNELDVVVGRIDYVNNDHISKYIIQDLNENFFNLLTNNINLADHSEVVPSLERIQKDADIDKDLIDDISNLKEDKANKVNEIEIVNNDNYLSSLGLTDEFTKFFDKIYPIGSIYISYSGQTPLYGTWEKLKTNNTLWNHNDTTQLGQYLGATLPNVKGFSGYISSGNCSGPFYSTGSSSVHIAKGSASARNWYQLTMDLSKKNSIYKDNATVKPPSINVTMYKRTK